MVVADTDRSALPESDKAFHIEQHGIDFVSETERWARPRDLFGMWAGASLQVEYFVYGVILMTFGFTFAQAVIITVLGNLSYVFLGLASLQGPQAGTTAMTINRAAYGPNGSRLIALFNWLTQVGFETEGLILVVFAAEALAIKAGYLPGTPAKVVFIVLAVLVQLLLPLLGHATMMKTLRALIVPFVVLFVILAAGLPRPHRNTIAMLIGHSQKARTAITPLRFDEEQRARRIGRARRVDRQGDEPGWSTQGDWHDTAMDRTKTARPEQQRHGEFADLHRSCRSGLNAGPGRGNGSRREAPRGLVPRGACPRSLARQLPNSVMG